MSLHESESSRVARPKIRTLSPIVAELVARRKALGLTQAEVAHRMNRQYSTDLSGWEYGRVDPQLRNLENWCAALGFELTIKKQDAA